MIRIKLGQYILLQVYVTYFPIFLNGVDRYFCADMVVAAFLQSCHFERGKLKVEVVRVLDDTGFSI